MFGVGIYFHCDTFLDGEKLDDVLNILLRVLNFKIIHTLMSEVSLKKYTLLDALLVKFHSFSEETHINVYVAKFSLKDTR